MSMQQLTSGLKNKNIDITCHEITCEILNVDELIVDNLEANQLTITSGDGIINRNTDLNLTAIDDRDINIYGSTNGFIYIIPGTNGYTYNNGRFDTNQLRLQTNTGITTGPGVNLILNPSGIVHIQQALKLKNPFSSISTSSELTGYSTGTFTLTFSGNCITTSAAQTIKYLRIGNQVTLQFPDLTFIKNNGAASQIVSGAIPSDLRPTVIGSGSYYMQLTSLQDQPLTDLCFAVVEYDLSITGIRLSKNDNYSTFSQAASPNNVQISACSLVYLI